uniref:Peptidyl-prolyl cis-trans isomerase n=1 Tax=Trypanosoma vivax (strain Y486) TaxID=1055687 RepID=G0TW02_TRYVY|nr:putative RNA-binding protein [Trypanosoma vivax Y486]
MASSVKHRPLITSAVLVETSLGSFVVDLYGADCPTATAEFVNLCRSKYFNGCIATEVVPENVMIFAHPSDVIQKQTFTSLVGLGTSSSAGRDVKNTLVSEKALRSNEMREEWRRMRDHTLQLCRGSLHTAPDTGAQKSMVGDWKLRFVALPAHEASGSIRCSGLLLLEVPRQVEKCSEDVDLSWRMRLIFTLSNRHLDYLEGSFMVLGEVREGRNVIEKMRGASYQKQSSASGITARPLRLIRIKHTTVLPTLGTDAFSDVCREGVKPGREEAVLQSFLMATGCFRHWASVLDVGAANKGLMSLLRNAGLESVGSSKNEGASTPVATWRDFFLLHDGPHQAHTNADYAKAFRSKYSADGRTVEGKSGKDDSIISVEYNPHYHGDFLSSDDDGDDGSDQKGGVECRRERADRRRAELRLQQDKLNETRALTLNLLDGIADVSGELKPQGNVLFVCKLNPFTTSEGLKMCFSQFGEIKSVEVLQDRKTGNSLCYGFVEFAEEEACFRAFQKMDNALIDDRRIHVDFSQSVSKLWADRQREVRKRARSHN